MTCRHIPQVSSSSLPSLSSSSSPLQCHYSTSNNTTTTTTRKTKKCSKFSLSSPSSSSSSSSSSLYTNNNNKSISTTTITITKDLLYSNLLVQYTTNANVLDQRELDSLKWVINQYGMGAPLDSSACNNLHFPYFSCQFVRGFYRVVRIEYEENNQIFQDNIDTTITELYFPDLERFYLYTDPFLEPSKNILSLLQNMPYLVDLRIRNQMRLTIIPDKFPFESKSLEVFRFTNNAAKEITNFNSTFYPKLKDFEFSIISSIPNDFGRGMTSKITVNVKSGSNLAPDSLCNVSSLSVQSYYPGLTSGYVANCFLCYLNIAPVHIHPQPVIPPLLDCPSIISVTGIRYTASKITIYGTNLGWAVQGDVDYLLTAIVPNSILEYGVNPLSPKFAASISEGDHPLASLSANRDTLQLFLSGSKGLKISVPLYKISLDDVVTRQESFSISVEMQVFFNPNLKHTFLFDGQPICSDLQPPLKPGILSCRVPILPTGGEQFNITVLNDYESSTFISTFTLGTV
ncbi:hypothetical protein DFA_06402 [Cavenderia fasciculata]|uniref:Uncharacterized protein n=1 Tax=Cavenderia fasciculata TaxID=261658 RepID=F4PIW6_CACFS|nr:uncharacterized protein DFA_06402 [Cavenderia fasciculata]EGG24252.1 hypothetical protein DFA_06402 [Cavenderia fasciculata]|eukprot:XP_004362103.1 hypothetical protein DFA_06402 [Cavenderia fasciculata]